MEDIVPLQASVDPDFHLPFYMTADGHTDVLFSVVIVFMVVLIFAIGVFYFKLHALPEKMAHDTNKTQFQVVAILALIALFTHNNMFWILALLLAAIRLPDFITPVVSIATSLERLANAQGSPASSVAPADSPWEEPDEAVHAAPSEPPATPASTSQSET